jgi:pseudouridine kinase
MTLSDSSTPTSMPNYVLAIGGANMDILGTAHNAWVMGDSNPGSIRCAPGGVARNVAENLARLGHTTHLISAIGDDAFGRSLLGATRAAGVHTSACVVLAQRNTSTYLSVHNPKGDLAVAVNDMDIVNSITPLFLAQHTALIKQARMVMLDCNLSADALAWLLAQAHATVVVDAVSRAKCQRIKPYLSCIHTLKLNQSEAQTLSGLLCNSPADMQTTASWLHAQGVQQVLISLGARGMFWSDANAGHGWQDAIAGDVVNVNGAGDALLAGWMHALLHNMPLAQAARFAQACAARTVGCASANHPDLSVASVNQFL